MSRCYTTDPHRTGPQGICTPRSVSPPLVTGRPKKKVLAAVHQLSPCVGAEMLSTRYSCFHHVLQIGHNFCLHSEALEGQLHLLFASPSPKAWLSTAIQPQTEPGNHFRAIAQPIAPFWRTWKPLNRSNQHVSQPYQTILASYAA